MHVDLSSLQEGASAELFDVVPWGLTRRLLPIFRQAADRAPDRTEDGSPVNLEEYLTDDESDAIGLAMVRQLVREWTVKDAAGKRAKRPKDLTDDEFDEIPASIVPRIIQECRIVMAGQQPDPKATSASQESSPETST